MARFIALLDASALFSIRVTNLALEIATSGIYQPCWSADIHEEWTRSLLKKNPAASADRIAYRRQQMDGAFPDALVTGYEPLVSGLALPDANDRHVLAAAIAARADVIVTFNTRDFPEQDLSPYGCEAQHPDTFLLHQMTLAPAIVASCARRVRKRLGAPQHSVEDFLTALRHAGLPLVAAELTKVKDLI